jgi:hypothetical protein
MVEFSKGSRQAISNWTYPTVAFNRQVRRGGLATGSISNLNTTTGGVTINEAGLYVVSVSVSIATSITIASEPFATFGHGIAQFLGEFDVYYAVNQAIRNGKQLNINNASAPHVSQITDYVYLEKGDVVTGRIFVGSQQDGKVGDILGSEGHGLTSMMVAKLSN